MVVSWQIEGEYVGYLQILSRPLRAACCHSRGCYATKPIEEGPRSSNNQQVGSADQFKIIKMALGVVSAGCHNEWT